MDIWQASHVPQVWHNIIHNLLQVCALSMLADDDWPPGIWHCQYCYNLKGRLNSRFLLAFSCVWSCAWLRQIDCALQFCINLAQWRVHLQIGPLRQRKRDQKTRVETALNLSPLSPLEEADLSQISSIVLFFLKFYRSFFMNAVNCNLRSRNLFST
jgi:hypothetical protein